MKKSRIIKLSLTILSIIFVFVFTSITDSIDSFFSSRISQITGGSQPDSNIVLINITSEDIEQIGPWPIKRSYYALLIQHLNKFKVNKIGLEVFLSSKFSTQGIYDNVLVKEIIKSNNVVLSSLAGEIKEHNNLFKTDEFSSPSPKLLNNSISTGHINYLKENGYLIPLTIKAFDADEYAFCYQLMDKKDKTPQTIKINFESSWKIFKQFSLLEFFQLVQEENSKLTQLKGKNVLIGVTDPQLAAVIQTPFDDEMPGLALHAFALSNLIQNSYYKTGFHIVSKIVFGLFVLIISFFITKKKWFYYGIALVVFMCSSIILQNVFFIEISYASFLIPFASLILIEVVYLGIENKIQLEGIFNEAELLKNLLAEKERTLASLQNELNVNNQESSSVVVSKIRELKADIERLRENEDDKQVVNIPIENDSKNFNGIIYKSDLMNNVVELIKKVSPTDATVMVTGESGTGKELVARSIHLLSKRKDQAFVAINCAALTESLLESELFGHVKGSFTGAVNDKAGKFELANNGTIFLDEIGETSENFQVKLLRVLQSGEFDKVGSSSTSKTDVRVIAATNKDIKQCVKENKFREDLYYRLNVIEIKLPSLSDRKEDIEPIINYYLQNETNKYQISAAALKSLVENNWKGNVRELESVIKRAKVFCDATERKIIQLNDLPSEIIKNIKLNFEDLVIESLRNKNFSHSAITETSKELGNVNRTIVSENFRGLALKHFVENNFNLTKTISLISNTVEDEVNSKVKAKMETWINNISKDLNDLNDTNFNSVKIKLNPKYKNLPQKFHFYLDEVIKYLLNSK